MGGSCVERFPTTSLVVENRVKILILHVFRQSFKTKLSKITAPVDTKMVGDKLSLKNPTVQVGWNLCHKTLGSQQPWKEPGQGKAMMTSLTKESPNRCSLQCAHLGGYRDPGKVQKEL